MTILKYSLLFIFANSMAGLQGQNPTVTSNTNKTSTTYALLCGVGEYKNKSTYKTLRFVDEDMKEFYDYLISPAGGKVDSANIDLLINKTATKELFWNSMINIMGQVKDNDVVYIYFAGHGDAIGPQHAYLLAYDAPAANGGKEKNHYFTGIGVINLNDLKGAISQMTLQKVKVIFISDACRSNEIPGGQTGQNQVYEKIVEKNAGEIQLTSCSSGQVAVEDYQWGNGRSVFSWHLINGLKGMADDNPENEKVTLGELYNYVKKQVQYDRFDAGKEEYLQTPYYCCSEKDAQVLSLVSFEDKKRLQSLLKNYGTGSKDSNQLVSYGGGIEYEMKAIGLESEYQYYLNAIHNNQLLGEKGAYASLKDLLSNKKVTPYLARELKFQLSTVLNEQVNEVINRYLQSNDKDSVTEHEYYKNAVRKLKVCIEITDPILLNPQDAKSNLLFLEGMACWSSPGSVQLSAGLAKLDSAIAIKPEAAYLINAKGLVLRSMYEYEKANECFHQAHLLAPNWMYPVFNMASVYENQGNYKESEVLYLQALALDADYVSIYRRLAWINYELNKKDSALYYCKKGISLNPQKANSWVTLAHLFKKLDQPDSAQFCYYRTLQLDSTNYAAICNIISFKLAADQTDSVEIYVDRIMQIAKKDPYAIEYLADTYIGLEKYGEAIMYLEKCLQLDSLNDEAWFDKGLCFFKQWDYERAEESFKKATELNPYNPLWTDYLGFVYLNYLQKYDRAVSIYTKLVERKPNMAAYHSRLGLALLKSDNQLNAQAESYFKRCMELDSTYVGGYKGMAMVMAVRGDVKACIVYLDEVVRIQGFVDIDLMAHTEFDVVKKNGRLKRYLKKQGF